LFFNVSINEYNRTNTGGVSAGTRISPIKGTPFGVTLRPDLGRPEDGWGTNGLVTQMVGRSD